MRLSKTIGDSSLPIHLKGFHGNLIVVHFLGLRSKNIHLIKNWMEWYLLPHHSPRKYRNTSLVEIQSELETTAYWPIPTPLQLSKEYSLISSKNLASFTPYFPFPILHLSLRILSTCLTAIQKHDDSHTILNVSLFSRGCSLSSAQIVLNCLSYSTHWWLSLVLYKRRETLAVRWWVFRYWQNPPNQRGRHRDFESISAAKTN